MVYISKSEGGVDALNFLVEKRDTRHWGTTSLLAVAALWKGCIQCRYTSSVLGRPRCQEDKSLIQDFIPRSPLSFLSALLPKAWSAQSLYLSFSFPLSFRSLVLPLSAFCFRHLLSCASLQLFDSPLLSHPLTSSIISLPWHFFYYPFISISLLLSCVALIFSPYLHTSLWLYLLPFSLSCLFLPPSILTNILYLVYFLFSLLTYLNLS